MADKTVKKVSDGNENIRSKDKKRGSGLERRLISLAFWPMILMGIVITIASYFIFVYNTQNEVRRNLTNAANSLRIHYDRTFPGDYTVEQDSKGQYKLLKGGTDISDTNEILDEFKAATGMEYAFFYLDVSMLTTIKDGNGERILYATAQPFVSDAVIKNNKTSFYNNIVLDKSKYFGIYLPLENADGTTIGMLFAGKSTYEVEKESMRAILWVPLITVIFSVIGALISTIPSKDIIKTINKEKKFLAEIAAGNLSASMDEKILHRKDELGDMAKFTQSVQRFIKDMIERDALTKLYTRRVGQSKINYTQYQLEEAGVHYCVCMADIDFFKNFNDTYGHDCGDLVLRETARIFNENMIGKGYTIRWGGEEFLVIYEDFDLDKAYAHLCMIRQKILENIIEYQGQKLSVTMTFGLTQGDNRSIDEVIKEADSLLYIGKQGGRNRIVTSRDASENKDELAGIREKQKNTIKI
ncbi:MAG: diguanylate cyclase [Lachnospiraceae bacterium]|nr:diguanylate cyclase [Lachnospiraceae bacterium]